MSDIKKDYNRLIEEIEDSISDIKEREVVKNKVIELSNLFISLIDKMSNSMEERMKELERKMETLENNVDSIEADIYEDDNGEFDFEIVCPYCNNEFTTDISVLDDEKTEIRCPECNNIIELDWNDDEESGCSGHCSRM